MRDIRNGVIEIEWLGVAADPAAAVLHQRLVKEIRPQYAAKRRQHLRRLVVVHHQVEILRELVTRPIERHVVAGGGGPEI